MSNLKVCGCSDANCTHMVMKTPTGWMHVANAEAGVKIIACDVEQDKLAA